MPECRTSAAVPEQRYGDGKHLGHAVVMMGSLS